MIHACPMYWASGSQPKTSDSLPHPNTFPCVYWTMIPGAAIIYDVGPPKHLLCCVPWQINQSNILKVRSTINQQITVPMCQVFLSS